METQINILSNNSEQQLLKTIAYHDSLSYYAACCSDAEFFDPDPEAHGFDCDDMDFWEYRDYHYSIYDDGEFLLELVCTNASVHTILRVFEEATIKAHAKERVKEVRLAILQRADKLLVSIIGRLCDLPQESHIVSVIAGLRRLHTQVLGLYNQHPSMRCQTLCPTDFLDRVLRVARGEESNVQQLTHRTIITRGVHEKEALIARMLLILDRVRKCDEPILYYSTLWTSIKDLRDSRRHPIPSILDTLRHRDRIVYEAAYALPNAYKQMPILHSAGASRLSSQVI